MTMTQTVDTASPPPPPERPATWGDIAVGYAREMASGDFRRGDLAELRRMDPDTPDAAVVWRLLARRDLLGSRQVENKWDQPPSCFSVRLMPYPSYVSVCFHLESETRTDRPCK